MKLIDLTGQELWSIDSDQQGNKLFAKPRSAASNFINDTLRIIVTDWKKDTITLLDTRNGDLIETCVVDVQGKSPHGLTMDEEGNVYICYFNTNEICIYSADLKKSRILLSSSDL